MACQLIPDKVSQRVPWAAVVAGRMPSRLIDLPKYIHFAPPISGVGGYEFTNDWDDEDLAATAWYCMVSCSTMATASFH